MPNIKVKNYERLNLSMESELALLKKLLPLLFCISCGQAQAGSFLPAELAQAIQSAINTHPEVMAADSQRLSAGRV